MSSKILTLMKEGMKVLNSTKRFDRLAGPLEVVTASTAGNCKFQWTVSEDQLNGMGTLHGGYTAYLVDYTTSAALMMMERNRAGVSVDMNITYLNPARPGDVMTVETSCQKYGYNLAFMDATFKNVSNGKIVATGKHTKFMGEGKGSERDKKQPEE